MTGPRLGWVDGYFAVVFDTGCVTMEICVCVRESFEKDDAGQTMGKKALNQDSLCLWECVSGLCYLSVSCLCSHPWLSHTINTDCRFTHSATEAENAHSHVCVRWGWQRFTLVRSWVEKRITLDSFPLGMSLRICNRTHKQFACALYVCITQNDGVIVSHSDKNNTSFYKTHMWIHKQTLT